MGPGVRRELKTGYITMAKYLQAVHRSVKKVIKKGKKSKIKQTESEHLHDNAVRSSIPEDYRLTKSAALPSSSSSSSPVERNN